MEPEKCRERVGKKACNHINKMNVPAGKSVNLLAQVANFKGAVIALRGLALGLSK